MLVLPQYQEFVRFVEIIFFRLRITIVPDQLVKEDDLKSTT